MLTSIRPNKPIYWKSTRRMFTTGETSQIRIEWYERQKPKDAEKMSKRYTTCADVLRTLGSCCPVRIPRPCLLPVRVAVLGTETTLWGLGCLWGLKGWGEGHILWPPSSRRSQYKGGVKGTHSMSGVVFIIVWCVTSNGSEKQSVQNHSFSITCFLF